MSRLIDLYNKNGSKWDSLLLSNAILRVRYFKPMFNTTDNLAVGLGEDGCGLEFSLEDHDGWELRSPDPDYLDFYRVIEAFRIKDKKYLELHSKEWHSNLDDALKVFDKEGYLITKVLKESKLVKWDASMPYEIVTSKDNSSLNLDCGLGEMND